MCTVLHIYILLSTFNAPVSCFKYHKMSKSRFTIVFMKKSIQKSVFQKFSKPIEQCCMVVICYINS